MARCIACSGETFNLGGECGRCLNAMPRCITCGGPSRTRGGECRRCLQGLGTCRAPSVRGRRGKEKDVLIADKPPQRELLADYNLADYSAAEIEFMRAIENYKRLHRRPFLAWSEVLQVALSLGYQKVARRDPLKTRSCPACGESTER